jgi:hypothetical protein
MNDHYVVEINRLKEKLLILEQSIISDKEESAQLVASLYKEIEELQLNEINEKIIKDDLKLSLNDLDMKYKEFIVFCENEKIKLLEDHEHSLEGTNFFDFYMDRYVCI